MDSAASKNMETAPRPRAARQRSGDPEGRHEQLLRQQRQVLAILGAMQDCVCIVDREGIIQYANPAMRKIFGPGRGHRCREYLCDGQTPCTWCDQPEALAKGTCRYEWTCPRNQRTYDVVDTPLAGSDGDLSLLKILHDISVHKEVEETIREKLERQVRQHHNQLQALSEQLLVAEEHYRRHISTVLHDSIGQLLSFSKRELTEVEKEVPEHRRERFNKALDQIEEAIRQSRDLTMEMSSPTLYTFGFEAAIEELGEILAAREGFAFSFQSDEAAASLTEDLQILLYRSTRELLTNAIQHSGGTSIAVRIEKANGQVQICVRDDGRGFDVAVINDYPADEKKYGLFSIKERLTYIGGAFKIESGPNGTQATILAPLRQKGNQR